MPKQHEIQELNRYGRWLKKERARNKRHAQKKKGIKPKPPAKKKTKFQPYDGPKTDPKPKTPEQLTARRIELLGRSPPIG